MEEWRDIEEYEGLYQVSNLGRVKSLPRLVCNHTGNFDRGEVVLKQTTYCKAYKRVNLYKQGEWHSYPVHRLVAIAFIPNPDGLPQINHKDENPSNNCVDNLEWCTAKYNMNYGNRPFVGSAKCIKQIDGNGEVIGKFRSISEASRYTGINRGNISSVLNGSIYRYNAGNYKWEFDYENVS